MKWITDASFKQNLKHFMSDFILSCRTFNTFGMKIKLSISTLFITKRHMYVSVVMNDYFLIILCSSEQ